MLALNHKVMLKKTFIELLENYTTNQQLILEFWDEIALYYSNLDRSYHTFLHLEQKLNYLILVKDKINNWNLILFSLYYHDVIYRTLSDGNELESATLLIQRLTILEFSEKDINWCYNLIMATKRHRFQKENDYNYLLDVNLVFLGGDWNTYYEYFTLIRKDFNCYSSSRFKQKRRRLIKHLLTKKTIYYTAFFRTKYELQARQNLITESESKF